MKHRFSSNSGPYQIQVYDAYASNNAYDINFFFFDNLIDGGLGGFESWTSPLERLEGALPSQHKQA